MKPISNDVKNAFKQPTTKRKGRILVNGNYYDVYNVEYYSDCYDEGKVIGNAIASQLDFDIPYMPKFDTFKYYDGVWTGSSYEYVDMGTFNVFDEKDQDEFNKHITSFDNLIKFNVPFEEIGTYPKTLYAELQNICNQAGVTLGNLSIPNGNFIIENNQYVNGESLKTVLKQICGISGNYAIMKDNTLYLQLKNTTDEVLDKYQHTPTDWKRRSYGINQVIIGNSQVEGEYVIREDAEDIELNGVHKLEVLDNLFAYTQDKRNALIDALWNQVRGFGYVPYETSGEWLNYLEIGDTITIDNVETILLRINAKSPKAVESTISAPAIIDSSIEYVNNTNDIKNQLKRTEIIVDKQNQVIEAVVSQINDIVTTEAETEVGNPLYIENAQNEKPIEFELYGDTLQDGTPTPDNPININVVTGRQEINVVGKNLANVLNGTYTTGNEITAVVEDGEITLNGTATANRFVQNFTDTLYLKTGTYTLSINNITTISGGNNNCIRVSDLNGTPISGSTCGFGTINNSTTFDIESDGYYKFQIRTNSGTTYSDFIIKPQLEQGSSATEYEPYNGNSYEINLGKNLYDPSFRRNDNIIYSNNCTIVENNGVFTLTATGTDAYMWSTANTGYAYDTRRGQLYEFDADTYTVTISNSLFTKNYVTFYDKNMVSLGTASKTSNTFSFNKNDKANAKYFTLRFGYGSATIGESYSYTIQLEKGTTATTYSPYKEPIELCKINDYQDKIFKRDNRWYLRKEIGKYVYNNDLVSNGIGTGYVNMITPILNVQPSANISAFCNMMLANVAGYTKINGTTSQNRIRVNLASTYATTYDEAKSLYAESNLTIYFPLETPTDTIIEDEELISQLDAFELETGINNITNTSVNLAGNMYLKYYLHTPISDTYVNQVELKSELKITSNEITSMVSETYATKDDTTSTSNPNSLSSRISQTAKSISLSINNGSTTSGIVITTTKEDGTTEQASGTIEMTGLVKFTDLSTSNPTTTIINGDNITTGTIKSSNYVANTSGTKIDLSNGTIDTKDFKVSSTGNITSTGGTIGGWEIQSYGLTKSFGTNGRYVFEIRTDRASNIACLGVWDNNTSSSNFYLTPEGYLYARNGSIGGGMITETITGASINLYNNPGFLKMSLGDTNHPFVSALNVALGSGGISFRNSGNRDNVGGEIGRIYGSSAGNVVIEGDTGTWIQDINIQTNYIMYCYQLSGLQDTYIRQNYSIVLKPNPNGGAYIWGTESYNAILTVGGSPSTLSIKTNVEKKDTSDIPNMLKQIELYDYKYIDEINNGENDYGYIIDYLEKIEGINKYFVFNEIERNGLKYKTINHEHLSKFLLGAVIELQKEINSLKEEK